MRIKEPEGFQRFKNKAEGYANDKEKASKLLDQAMIKAEKNRGRLANIWNDLTALFRLVRAWIKGEYNDVPTQTIILAIGAIVYFIMPVDLITDLIPGVGYIDDAGVIAFVLASSRQDVRRFLDWEGNLKVTSKEAEQTAIIESLKGEVVTLAVNLECASERLASTIKIGAALFLLMLAVIIYQLLR